MIHIDVTTATIHVEPDGNSNRLAIIETLETAPDGHGPGSVSRVDHIYGDGVLSTYRTLEEEIRARSTGGRVSREYAIIEPGRYAITSGLRDNAQSRVFHINFRPYQDGRFEMIVEQNSTVATWIVGDHLSPFDGTAPMLVGVEIGDVVEVSTAGQVGYKRSTSWDRILDDEDSV